jgi:hypothetical protein
LEQVFGRILVRFWGWEKYGDVLVVVVVVCLLFCGGERGDGKGRRAFCSIAEERGDGGGEGAWIVIKKETERDGARDGL